MPGHIDLGHQHHTPWGVVHGGGMRSLLDLRLLRSGSSAGSLVPHRCCEQGQGAAGGSQRFGVAAGAAQDEGAMMPHEHGRRLTDLLPDARLVEIDDSGTLIPEDQPEQLATVLWDFVPASFPAG